MLSVFQNLSPGHQSAPACWLANLLFGVYAGRALAWAVRCPRAEVVHVQSKHMLVSGVPAARRLEVPVLVTPRDASIVDTAPMCVHHGGRMPPDCGVATIWGQCAPEYLALYDRPGRHPPAGRQAFLSFWLDSRLK